MRSEDAASDVLAVKPQRKMAALVEEKKEMAVEAPAVPPQDEPASSEETPLCRVCFMEGSSDNPLYFPCLCKGKTLAFHVRSCVVSP